jgi:hypothetical protein
MDIVLIIRAIRWRWHLRGWRCLFTEFRDAICDRRDGKERRSECTYVGPV